MAVITPAIGIQGGSHSAQAFRQLASALTGQDIETFVNAVDAVGPGHGLVKSGDLAVAEKGTPDMSVDVAAGLALITGDQSLAQGIYAFANDAVVNLTVTTADGSNPRWDLVCAQIRDDDEDGGGTDDARLMIVDGTAAASPADPTIPDGVLVLARVVVGTGVTSITDTDITTLASVCQGSTWGTAWGTVGYAQVTGNESATTTLADLTGLSITFNADAGRRYRTSFYGRIGHATIAVSMTLQITDGSNVIKQYGHVRTFPDATFAEPAISVSAVETGLSGVVTRKMRIDASASVGAGLRADSIGPAFILVEDIGPSA